MKVSNANNNTSFGAIWRVSKPSLENTIFWHANILPAVNDATDTYLQLAGSKKYFINRCPLVFQAENYPDAVYRAALSQSANIRAAGLEWVLQNARRFGIELPEVKDLAPIWTFTLDDAAAFNKYSYRKAIPLIVRNFIETKLPNSKDMPQDYILLKNIVNFVRKQNISFENFVKQRGMRDVSFDEYCGLMNEGLFPRVPTTLKRLKELNFELLINE